VEGRRREVGSGQVGQPLLDAGHVELVGEVGGEDKSEFLGHALALLNPIDWPEPFGLVMAEALACGTPVVARRRGSVPEVVSDGRTGLIGETDDDLAHLCRGIHQVDRAACRREALNRFTPAVMADGYEAAYRSLLRCEDTRRPRRRALSTPRTHHARPSFDGEGRPLRSFGPA